MANVKISALPPATSALVTDEFPINQGGTTKKLTLDQIKSVIGGGTTTNTTNVTVSGFDPNTAECDSTLVWDCTLKQFVATKEPKFISPPAGGAIKYIGKSRAALNAVMAVTTDNRVVYWGNDEDTIGNRNTAIPPSNYARMKFINNNGENPTHEDYMVINPTLEVVDLQYGRYGAMALLSDGTVWINGYGPNMKMHLQISKTHDLVSTYTRGYFLKVNIPSDVKVTKIYYGGDNDEKYYNYICLTDTKNVYVFGSNRYGSCGVGTAHDTKVTPTLVTNSAIGGKAIDIYTGWSDTACSLILTDDGKLFGAGYNGYGQLGTGNTTNQISFVQIDTDVRSIANNNMWLTARTVMYIKNNGTIWGTGYSGYYQLGGTTNATTPRQVTQPLLGNFTKIVTSGLYYNAVMAMTNTGQVYTWGYNHYGTIGDGTQITRQTPYQITGILADDIYMSQNYYFVSNKNNYAGNYALIKAKNNMLYAAGYKAYTTSISDPDSTIYSTFRPYNIHLIKDKIKDIGLYGYNVHYGTFLTTTDGHLLYNGISSSLQGSNISLEIREFSYVM